MNAGEDSSEDKAGAWPGLQGAGGQSRSSSTVSEGHKTNYLLGGGGDQPGLQIPPGLRLGTEILL